ncbi:hypothetical protein JCM12856_25470 [Spirochaeta dissipatitropha]
MRDIQTADYYELLETARQEGLSTSGTIEQLRTRLYTHYDLSSLAESQSRDQQETGSVTIRVLSAQQTRYETSENDDEELFILSGGVVIALDDTEEGQRHSIEADQVFFNRSRETITAQGNVTYSLIRGNDTETYRGEIVSFRMKNWSGAFAEGGTMRSRTIDSTELMFSYSGDFITRSSGDVVVMEDGTITSSESDPPNYRIKAGKIWVFAPGEWGLQNAVLYVGRIPLFYFPFYFNQGRDLFFSPALASFPVEGQAVFTTTYLYGDREEEDSPISVLQLAEAPDRTGRRRISGLFFDDEAGDDEDEHADRSLKIMADLYSNRGAFLALDGTFPEAGNFRNVVFWAGLGRTRDIFRYNNGYSHWYRAQDGIESVWHSSYLLGSEFPFRYGMQYSSALTFQRIRTNISFQHYSDPEFRREQSRRNESFQILQLITRPDPPDSTFSRLNNYNWSINNSLSYSPATRFINSISISSLNFRLDWHSREIASQLVDPRTAAMSNQVQNQIKHFFVPRLLEFPRIQSSISGRLISSDRAARPPSSPEEETSKPEATFPVEAPWESLPVPEPAENKAPLFQLPELQRHIPVPQQARQFQYTLDYTLRPDYRLEAYNHYAANTIPSETRFSPRYFDGRSTPNGSISQSLNMWQRVLGINNSLRFTASYRHVFAEHEEVETESERRSAILNNRLTINSTNDIQLRPLESLDIFRGSSIRHDFNTQAADFRIDPEQELDLDNPSYQWISEPFELDSISTHKLNSTLNVNILGRTQQATVNFQLPPLEKKTEYSLLLRYGFGWYSGSQTWKWEHQEDEEELIWKPMTFSNQLKTEKVFSLTQNGNYNIEEERLESLGFNLDLWSLKASLNYQYTTPYVLDMSIPAWVAEEEKAFIPTRGSINYSYSYDPLPFWKNRFRINSSLSTALVADFNRFTESSMNISFKTTMDLHKLFRLEVSSKSVHNTIFLYVPELARQAGLDPVSPVSDIAKGFRFWDRQEREESNFNLENFQLKGIYRMGDWDFTTEYTGRSSFSAADNEWSWTNNLSLELVWKPISELSTEINIDDDGMSY